MLQRNTLEGFDMSLSKILMNSTIFLVLGTTQALAQETAPDQKRALVGVQTDSIALAPPRIQVALLLDTSNSMDGLISQAKSQLWMLVNELGEGEKNGKKPQIELSLYEYGNSNLSVSSGYIRQVLPLTTDLDDVSEKLFALKTRGGSEHAGQVIMTALENLTWSDNSNDMKLVIIAGNEPFTQGPVSYESACARAQRQGVIIDTIHCGDEQVGIDTKWKAGADCGSGVYMTINQDEESVYIASPYDDEILNLNKKLNDTYMGYGRLGEVNKVRQAVQDSNASGMSLKSAISRAKSKASSQYKNESWDLVDGYKADKDKVLTLPESELPDELKGLTKEERAAMIEAKSEKRKSLQAEIKALEKKREAHVAKETAVLKKSQTLDEVVVSTVRKQAQENGFKYKN